MFELFKRMIRKDPPAEEVTLRKDALQGWFEERAVPLIKDEQASVKGFVRRLEAIKAQIREDLDALEHAELKNKNIPNRHLQFLEGNRPAYLQKIRAFLEQAALEDSFEGLRPFVETVEERLALLTKATTKSYMILQEFFANESYKVAAGIKAIDHLAKDISRYLEESPYAFYRKAVDAFGSLEAFDEKQRGWKRGLDERKTAIRRLREEKDLLVQEQAKIKRGKPYEEHLADEKETKLLEDRQALLRNEISREFATLSKAMKKYERTALDPGMLARYLVDPHEALQQDKDLTIISTFGRLNVQVKEGKIEVKNPDKVQETIGSLGKERLEAWQERSEEIAGRLASLKGKDPSGVLAELRDIERRLPLVEQDIHREESLLERESKAVAPEERDRIYRTIREACESLFRIKLTIVG